MPLPTKTFGAQVYCFLLCPSVSEPEYVYPENLVNTWPTSAQETHQEMRYPNVTSLYFAARLAFNASDEGVSLGRSP